MSKYFERIKFYYENGLYRIDHLKKLVQSGAITADEYQEITGDAYAA